jgi:hypothetical protein
MVNGAKNKSSAQVIKKENSTRSRSKPDHDLPNKEITNDFNFRSMRALLAQRLHESSQKEEKVDHSSYTKWNGSARMDNLSLAGEHLNLNETNFLTEVTKLFTYGASSQEIVHS